MKIYVSRHGQTQWNAENKVCGRTDIPLNEVGISQAKAMADKAKDCNINIIISSPMIRAMQTAQRVREVTGLEIIKDERLIEQDFGIYEGKDRFDEGFRSNKRKFVYSYPNGESMFKVAQRVYNLLDEVIEKYNGKNVLLVCHGGICRIIRTYFEDMENEEFASFSAGNADLMEFEV